MEYVRPKYSELTPLQKMKANARSKAKMALKRGRIKRKACEVCGDPETQMHHDDYNKPYDVIFLCHTHHKERDAVVDILTRNKMQFPSSLITQMVADL